MLSIWMHVAVLGMAPQAEPAPRIELRPGQFVIRTGKEQIRIPLAAPPDREKTETWPPKRLLFRKDAAYAVWDSRGLSVRQKSWVFTTRLEEIPTSPKIFSREEILETKAMMEEGLRSKSAAQLSGAIRDGTSVYFLARWEETGGKPWLEALVRVVLTDDKPKPKLVGRFPGLSLSVLQGKSRLFFREDDLAAWIKSEQAWGLGVFDPKTETFDFRKVGGRISNVSLGEGRIGWFIEETNHPSRILHRWDRETLASRPLLETRGSVRLIDDREPWIASVQDESGSFLHNLQTGARLPVPAGSETRRTTLGVLVWAPASEPATARLFEPLRWTPLAAWQRAQSRP